MPRSWKLAAVGLVGLIALALFFLVTLHPSHSSAQMRPKPPIPRPSSLSPAALQTARNLGKAYYEQGQYPQSVAEFRKVVAAGHALATDYLDLGLGLMQSNHLNSALGALTTAKQMAPRLIAVDYNLGILYKRELRYPLAEAALRRVTVADPSDPSAWFNLGEVYFAEHKLQQSLDANLRIYRMGLGRGENFYVAALFHLFTLYVRLRQMPEAQKYLKLHAELQHRVPSISLEAPALEGGKYGAILVPNASATEVTRLPGAGRVAFTDLSAKVGVSLPAQPSAGRPPVELRASDYSLQIALQKLVPQFGPSLAVGDYDGNGLPDLYIVNPAGKNHLLHNNGNGTFTDVTAKAGVAGPGGAVSATFADYNNSGHPSLFVAGLGGVRLYKNLGNGSFVDVTAKAGLKPEPDELDTRAILFDADNDGFLDLLVTAYTEFNHPPHQGIFRFPNDFPGATVHFYHNNGDGTFTEATSAVGLAAAKGRWLGGVFADFNNDGYTDLLLYRDDGPPVLYLNQADGKFADRTREAGRALSRATVLNAQVTDFDHDGDFDLALWTPSGYEALRNNGKAEFTPLTGLPQITPPKAPFAFRGLLVDANGDSYSDFLMPDAQGAWHLIADRAGRFHPERIHVPAPPSERLSSLTSTWLTKPSQLDLIGVTRQGRLTVWQKEGAPEHWLEVNMDGYKSNKEGVGSIVEFKAGNFYKKVEVTGGPVRIFTGDVAKLDVVRATWPNQIVQNHINVATDKAIAMRESERMASSCPLLYAWNGTRFAFVTDVLGVGPLGELAPDGSYIRPYPEEYVRLPETLRQRDGAYLFRLTDEMRETDYFDSLRLLAVDHPANERVYANEIYSPHPTPPALYAVHNRRFPVSAVGDHGRSVLPLLLKADGRYVTDFRPIGIPGMAETHSLTLNLGAFPSSDHIALWLTGWVYWTDSNGARALNDSRKLRMTDPYLQVRNAEGRWVTAIPDIGLPSGTDRTMRVDLTGKFLTRDHHLRIVTNLCVYWDQIFFTTNESRIRPNSVLPLQSANLHYRGFSVAVSDPLRRKPDYYEYTHLMEHAPWNPMAGPYTRYGNVLGLLQRPDDRLVVMATGDEMSVAFSPRNLPPLKAGWKRDFFLDATGYAKDGEPNTAFAKTSTPLPFRAMSNYPPAPTDRRPAGPAYRRYVEDYETRPGYALIPPLAPPNQ
jgi:tetratricopeptide (TPR) repeat protein